MKEGRCFSCKEVGHRAPECANKQKPQSHQTMDCLMNKQKPISKLSVSRMVLKKLKQEKPRAKASRAEMPHAKKPPAEKPLIVLSSSLPGDFFAEEALIAPCMLRNNGEIKTTALLDTGATGYSFVDPVMARRVCDDLEIGPIQLSKPKAIQDFNGKRVLDVTHAIYPTTTVQDHRETVTPMLITKLDQHQIILGKPWMKKHGVILDMRNDQPSFWPGHCQHTKESHAKQPHAEKPCAKKPRAEEPHAGRPMTISKRQSNELPELLPYLLPSTQGVSKVASTSEAIEPEKKKKKKPSTIPQKPKAEVEDEENDPKELKSEKPSVEWADSKPLDLALIGETLFIRLAKSKKPEHRAEIFAISMRDIKYQLNKGTKPLTDPKTVVPEEYHDFLDVFSKDISDTLRPYGKYNHKIKLLKDNKLSNLGHSRSSF